jgi:hypothetical protein
MGRVRRGGAADDRQDGAVARVVVAAALAALVAVLLAAALGPVTFQAGSPLDRLRLGDGAPEAPPAQEGVDEAPVEALDPPEPLLDIPAEVLVSMVAVIVASALLVRSLLRARRPPEQDDGDDDEVPEGLVEGHVDLDAVAASARRSLLRLAEVPDEQASEAVIACWVELELAGGRAGSAHRHTDSPTDFARRLAVVAPDLDDAVLDDLRRVYSRVRYGGTGATRDDVVVARTALEHLLAAIAPSRAGAPT